MRQFDWRIEPSRLTFGRQPKDGSEYHKLGSGGFGTVICLPVSSLLRVVLSPRAALF